MLGWILYTHDPADTEPAPVRISNDRRELEAEAAELQATGLKVRIAPAGQGSLFSEYEDHELQHRKHSRQENLLDYA